jgi:tetratricopeptide (TPR) repeat protein
MMKRLVTTGIVLFALGFAVNVPGQQAAKQQVYRLSLPDKNWALEVPLEAFYAIGVKSDMSRVDLRIPPQAWFSGPVESLSDDGREYSLLAFQKTDRKSSSAFSRLEIRLRPALMKGGALEFRDFALKERAKKNYVKSSSVKTWEHGQIPVARYTLLRAYDGGNVYTGPIPRVESGPRNVEAYFIKDDVWITLTFTASPFDEEEEKLFDALVDSVTFVDTSVSSSSFDYYHKGRVLFMNREYSEAAQALGAALTLEQRQLQLDTAFWRDLIGKLADAYGALVNRAKAKEVLEYGINNDPTNTAFHMGLARLCAREGDIDSALAALEKAAFYFKSSMPSKSLPDLNYDPAFARLMKVDRFRKAVKAMKSN